MIPVTFGLLPAGEAVKACGALQEFGCFLMCWGVRCVDVLRGLAASSRTIRFWGLSTAGAACCRDRLPGASVTRPGVFVVLMNEIRIAFKRIVS